MGISALNNRVEVYANGAQLDADVVGEVGVDGTCFGDIGVTGGVFGDLACSFSRRSLSAFLYRALSGSPSIFLW